MPGDTKLPQVSLLVGLTIGPLALLEAARIDRYCGVGEGRMEGARRYLSGSRRDRKRAEATPQPTGRLGERPPFASLGRIAALQRRQSVAVMPVSTDVGRPAPFRDVR